MKTPDKASSAIGYLKNKQLWICILAIFLGGAAECTMSQWSSGYLEAALGIPKAIGDIFGVALFGLMLGLGRSLYAKRGKNIEKVPLLSAIGASVCYLVAVFSPIAAVGLIAAALTGFATAMLWPGCLILSEKRIPITGVFVYAMMASGGDLGASVGPQLVGLITDAAIEIPSLLSLADKLSLTPDQLGMKLGLLVGMLFPLVAVPFHIYNIKSKKN
jgi:fucose permease